MSNHEHAHGDPVDHHHEHDHAHGAGHGHGHDHGRAHQHETPCCGSACGAETKSPVAATSGGLLLRIPALDCPTEEGQIRRALERFPEVRGLRFDLPARALDIDAPQAAWEPVIAAINGIGFKTETLSAPPPAEDTAKAPVAEIGG